MGKLLSNISQVTNIVLTRLRHLLIPKIFLRYDQSWLCWMCIMMYEILVKINSGNVAPFLFYGFSVSIGNLPFFCSAS
jgi:hypothetical protein